MNESYILNDFEDLLEAPIMMNPNKRKQFRRGDDDDEDSPFFETVRNKKPNMEPIPENQSVNHNYKSGIKKSLTCSNIPQLLNKSDDAIPDPNQSDR